jgi:hypothetical protein
MTERKQLLFPNTPGTNKRVKELIIFSFDVSIPLLSQLVHLIRFNSLQRLAASGTAQTTYKPVMVWRCEQRSGYRL